MCVRFQLRGGGCGPEEAERRPASALRGSDVSSRVPSGLCREDGRAVSDPGLTRIRVSVGAGHVRSCGKTGTDLGAQGAASRELQAAGHFIVSGEGTVSGAPGAFRDGLLWG